MQKSIKKRVVNKQKEQTAIQLCSRPAKVHTARLQRPPVGRRTIYTCAFVCTTNITHCHIALCWPAVQSICGRYETCLRRCSTLIRSSPATHRSSFHGRESSPSRTGRQWLKHVALPADAGDIAQ